MRNRTTALPPNKVIQLLAMTLSETGEITSVYWYSPANGTISTAPVSAIVDYVENLGRVVVCDGSTVERVAVDRSRGGPPKLLVASKPLLPLPLPVR